MKKLISAAVCLLLAGSIHLYAHCQIPCGIYDDPLRTSMIYEDLNTIDKSVAAIRKLSGKKQSTITSLSAGSTIKTCTRRKSKQSYRNTL